MHGGSLTLSLVPIRVHPHPTPQTTCPSVEPVSASDHTAHTAHAALDITASSPGRPSHQARVLPQTSLPRLQVYLPSLGTLWKAQRRQIGQECLQSLSHQTRPRSSSAGRARPGDPRPRGASLPSSPSLQESFKTLVSQLLPHRPPSLSTAFVISTTLREFSFLPLDSSDVNLSP